MVVALKSRTIPAPDAVAQSLAALAWLQQAGAQQFYFKYCSTFDSTPKGNIGPVTDALMDALGTDFTIACPAFPENGRTICHGYLFVGDVLLSESGMKDHPLTPMTDANLVRVLQAQTQAQGRPHPLRHARPRRRSAARTDRKVAAAGSRHRHRRCAGRSRSALHRRGLCRPAAGDGRLRASAWASPSIIAAPASSAMRPRPPPCRGSEGHCRRPLGQLLGGHQRPGRALDAVAARVPHRSAQARGRTRRSSRRRLPGRRRDWQTEPVLIYATSTPQEVKAVQRELGVERAGALVEDALARIAKGLVAAGVRRLVVAGGETSGAVVGALGIREPAHRPADRSRRALDRKP